MNEKTLKIIKKIDEWHLYILFFAFGLFVAVIGIFVAYDKIELGIDQNFYNGLVLLLAAEYIIDEVCEFFRPEKSKKTEDDEHD